MQVIIFLETLNESHQMVQLQGENTQDQCLSGTVPSANSIPMSLPQNSQNMAQGQAEKRTQRVPDDIHQKESRTAGAPVVGAESKKPRGLWSVGLPVSALTKISLALLSSFRERTAGLMPSSSSDRRCRYCPSCCCRGPLHHQHVTASVIARLCQQVCQRPDEGLHEPAIGSSPQSSQRPAVLQ